MFSSTMMASSITIPTASVSARSVMLFNEKSIARISVKVEITDAGIDRKSTRLNSSHSQISYAVFCLKKEIRQSASAVAVRDPASLLGTGRVQSDRHREREPERTDNACAWHMGHVGVGGRLSGQHHKR